MAVLQDQCPREEFSTIKSIVEKQLDFDAVFASFEEEPIGAASIGQGLYLLTLIGSDLVGRGTEHLCSSFLMAQFTGPRSKMELGTFFSRCHFVRPQANPSPEYTISHW